MRAELGLSVSLKEWVVTMNNVVTKFLYVKKKSSKGCQSCTEEPTEIMNPFAHSQIAQASEQP